MFTEYLKSGTEESSIRLVLVWAMWLMTSVFVAIDSYIIIAAIKSSTIEFTGITILITSLGVFITPFLYYKNKQKRLELNK